MALHGFVRLGPHILLYTPSPHQAGQLILLCTWMGAADKHIQKYTDLYRQKAPGAKILLLKSVVGSMISSYSSQRRALRPAQQAVGQALQEHEKPRILLHIMSNGGANSAANLLVGMEREWKAPLPVVGMVCDSTPNASSYTNTCNAFMYSFPWGFPANLLAAAFVHMTIALLYLWIALGNEAPEDYWRRSVLDETLVRRKRACYIASKADRLTEWRDVVSHAAEARRKGWATREILVDDTPHCHHMSKHQEAYVGGVMQVWEGAGAGWQGA